MPRDVAAPVRIRTALVADLFCGAGGSSTGARRALAAAGFRMALVAVNHWPVAIETHSRNHPDARHFCMDLEAAKPEDLVPEGRLDLLMASPTCTYHSRARGGRPVSDQQRMDPWHVVRWCTTLRVRRLIVENVPEFVDWGPVGRDGRPLRSRKGEYFRAWLKALQAIGLRCEWRILNAADYGDPTTRRRFFLIGRADRLPLRWPQPTHAPAAQAHLLGLEPWRAAREVIDWSLPGTSIFERKRPLSPNTIRRIAAGIRKFGGPLAEPFLVVLRRNCAAASIDGPVPVITAQARHVALVEPELRPFVCANRTNNVPQDIDGPVPTIVTSGALWLAQPELKPFVLGQQSGSAPRPVDRPLPTVAAGGAISLVEPFVTAYYGSSEGGKSCDEPLDTVTTRDRFGLVEPFLLPQHGDRGGPPRTHAVDRPVPTVTTVARVGLVEPFLVPQFGERPGQAPRTHEIEDPLPAVTSHGAGALVAPELTEGAGDDGRTVIIDGQPYRLDIRFRMLRNHELARAMGFSDAEAEYEFAGNATEITRQIGNAVPVNTAAALVAALMAPGNR